ncbi:MAG: hypothetical protein GF313_10605 [Caldithrix sp.]|nr:hypothetical protein [Caldithrix sp.]
MNQIKGAQDSITRLDTIALQTSDGHVMVIVPSFGGNVAQLQLKKDDHLYSVLNGNQRPAEFSGKSIFKGAQLLPFANRLNNGRFAFAGQGYQMALNYPEEGHACHGFVYEQPFNVLHTKKSDGQVQARLSYDYHGSISGFPFPFRTELTYDLSNEQGFTCQTRVINTGQQAMPLSHGWHPFLQIENRSIDDLQLQLPPAYRLELNSRMIPTGHQRPFLQFIQKTLIGSTELDDCFRLEENGDRIQYIELTDPSRDLTLRLWQESGTHKYNYVQIYTPPNRQSIAVEPMTSNVDAFNNGRDLIVLKPGQAFTAAFGIQMG